MTFLGGDQFEWLNSQLGNCRETITQDDLSLKLILRLITETQLNSDCVKPKRICLMWVCVTMSVNLKPVSDTILFPPGWS